MSESEKKQAADAQIERPIKVIICKIGLDGHDRGVRVVARALRDAGMEVIYLGLRQTPDSVAQAALQEDADCVGLSMHNAAHMTLLPKTLQKLKERGLEHVLLTGGGIFPREDVEALQQMGVGRLFPPGASGEEFCTYIRDEVIRRRREGSG